MKWICFFCLGLQTIFGEQSYITYGGCQGRFGDQLLNYLHAKWLSYEYQIPILYRYVPYFPELMLSEIEAPFEATHRSRLSYLDLSADMPLSSDSSLVYMCPYFPALKEEQEGYWKAFEVNWKDPEFRRLARGAIAPKVPLNLTYPPPDTISIAIHVREGGGYDRMEHLSWGDPFKAPPMNFYTVALNRILPELAGKKIYCHVFTDAQEPETIVRQIKQTVPPGYQILFGCRKMGNHHTKNVLEDFFSLFNFDILIRPRSNFSVIPSLLSDYALLCTPAEFFVENKMVTLTRIEIERNEDLFSQLLRSH